ncbi:MAG: biotin--[acetyl-CoA-carboxylase] ligase [Spirochaetaceae bacterium]|nr:MAG: biotin--[acetyl-CoA-carboxylase] ligase [Spirochaetaceae bacterium]
MLLDRYTVIPQRSPLHDAPIFWCRSTGTTMDDARLLGDQLPSGSVLVADEQTAGRGRGEGRVWHAAAGENLLFTLLVDDADAVPTGSHSVGSVPLRAGLAVADVALGLGAVAGSVRIKWPNDILIHGAKTCGILCEGRGGRIHIGIGLNLNQERFSVESAPLPPTSLAAATGHRFDAEAVLLMLLERLRRDLRDGDWRRKVELHLFRESVICADGECGRVEGIGDHGELLVARTDGSTLRVLQPDQVVYASRPSSPGERE